MRSILLALVLGVTIPVVLYSGYLMMPKNETQALSGFSDPFVSIQLATSPSNGNCLTTDGTNNSWGSCASGSSKWTDATTFIYPTGGLYASAPKFVATSSVASEFPYASSTAITATNFWGTASLATALGANGSNCSSGSAPLGVDASGAVESCFDVWTEAENTSAGYLSTVDISANTNLTVTATGLQLSSDAIALTAGYIIPLSASTTNWNAFYDAPSNRITAGTGIDWSGNTLNGVYTAGDALTLTGEDFDFDGGATPSGDLGGTWASPSVSDDSHAHTGTTLSGIDISSDTNLSADGTEIVLTGDALSLGNILSFTYASTTAISGTNLDFTNATGTTLRGFGLFDCDSASNAVTWDVTAGKFGCNTITGGGSSNWNQSLGTYLTPSTTLGIRVNASSTIGDGTALGGLSIFGNSTTTATSSVGNLIVKGSTSNGTTTTYIYSKTTNYGGQIVIEDSDGAGCTVITALNGVLSASIASSCPTEY